MKKTINLITHAVFATALITAASVCNASELNVETQSNNFVKQALKIVVSDLQETNILGLHYSIMESAHKLDQLIANQSESKESVIVSE